MKKLNFRNLILFSLIIGLLVLAGCGQGDSEEATTNNDSTANNEEETTNEESTANENEESTEANDSAEGPQDSVELSISHFVPAEHGYHTKVFEPFAEELEERTEGRVTATIYPGAALGEATAQYEMVTEGVADISYAIQSYTPGRFPLTSALELPFLTGTPEKATNMFDDLYDAFPEIQEEYQHNKVLWLFGIDNDQILTTDQKIESLEDLEGLRISTPTEAASRVVEAWGATAVFQPMNEVYEAMQRGVVDGRMGPYSGVLNFGLHEVTNYITEADFFTTLFVVSMNQDVWDSLSEEDQNIIDDMADKYQALGIEAYADDAADGRAIAEESGVEITVLSEDQQAEFEEAILPHHEQWVENMEADGLPGTEVYEEAVRLSEEHDE